MLKIQQSTDTGWSIKKFRNAKGSGGVRRGTQAEKIFPEKFLQSDGIQIEDIYEIEPKQVKGRRAGSPRELAVDIDVGKEESCLVAVRHPSGALTFHPNTGMSEGSRRGGSKDRTIARFRIPLRQRASGNGRRGIISKAVKVVVVKVAKAAVDKAVSLVLPKLAEKWETWSWSKKNLTEGWFQVIRQSGQDPGIRLESALPVAGQRNLLFIHGTFSHASSAFGSLAKGDFFDRLHSTYGDRIYAFNHFTLSRTPEENAQHLLKSLTNKVYEFDVITHSRGGLVLRSLVELNNGSRSTTQRFHLRHAVLVASPNDGTPLARPSRWEETVGWVANLMEMFPDNPFTTGAEFVSEAIVWLASHVAGDLPGLHSMDEGSEVLASLQSPPGPPRDAYSALVANVHPEDSLWQRILDVGVDHFFGSANDLVVPTEGGWMIDRDGQTHIPSDRIGCFGPGGNILVSKDRIVNHTNFFQQPETIDFLVKALIGKSHDLVSVNLAQALPHRRLARSVMTSTVQPPLQAESSRLSKLTAAPSRITTESMLLSLRDDIDTFHIVILDRDEDQNVKKEKEDEEGKKEKERKKKKEDEGPKFTRVFASYRGARVVEKMQLSGGSDGPRTSFGKIIRFHESIKNYTNRVRGSLPSDEKMRQFGIDLFETLFQGDVRRLYDEARASQRGRKLDLILTSMIDWVADKPWEFAYDPSRECFLATEEIHFVRNVLTAIPADIIRRNSGPLRMLVASSQPVGFGRLSVDQELEVIRRGFEPLIEAGLVTVEVLPRATPSVIHGYLSTGNYNVVHFIGHGVFDEQEQQGYLIFEDNRRNSFRLGQRQVREIFCQRGINLVFLNACQTAEGSTADFNMGIAQSLVAHGLPALVANQYSVLDSSATSFAQHFYWSLAQGMSLGKAARESRIAVNYALQGELIDWAVPVVYAQDPNYTLCETPATRSRIPATTVRSMSQRRILDHSERIAVWDIDHVFPGLATTLGKMSKSQSTFGFELADLSAPLGVWDLEQDSQRTPYLWAERLAKKIESATVQLQVDLIACITRHWLRDDDWINLYGWWPSRQKQKVVIFSCADFEDLAVEGLDMDRTIANVAVTVLTGFYGNLDSHKRGPKTCPLYFNEERDLQCLKGKQTFDSRCRKSISQNRKLAKKLPALEALLKVFN